MFGILILDSSYFLIYSSTTLFHIFYLQYVKYYAMLSKYGNCTRLLKIKNKLKIGSFSK